MGRVWELGYSLVIIPLFWIVLRTVGLFSSKVRRGVRGRSGLFEALARKMAAIPPGKRVWFHSSSLGEFEQAKPIIEELKRRNPTVRIIASFFSPSGFEHSRRYSPADIITYLPFDTRRGARMFLDLIRPDAAVMVRYDIWPNHIWELHRRQVPVLIANATMKERTPRRLPVIRAFHRHVYDAIDEILTVAPKDVDAFREFGLAHARIQTIGDTRFDQVSLRSTEARKHSILPPAIIEGKKVIVAGSSWPEDEETLIPAFSDMQAERGDLLLILVPHEPTLDHLEDLERELEGKVSAIRFSCLNEYRSEHVVIVDSIGILLKLYAYAHVAYVGGSFRQGVHNVLEAAVYGVPVVFGPRHLNSHEPLLLANAGGAFVVNDSEELHRTLDHLLSDERARCVAGERASSFVQSNTGATGRFLEYLEPALHANGTGNPR